MAHNISHDPNARLRRQSLAQALTAAGFPTSEKTLATQASRGGGPPYRKYGRVPLYTWGEALVWAEQKLTGPYSSTSEADTVETVRSKDCPAIRKE